MNKFITEEDIKRIKRNKALLKLDNLGMEHYINGFAKYLATAPTPSSIGIQGESGCGKTCMLQLTADKLIENGFITEENPVIWIDVCEYIDSANDEKDIVAFFIGKVFRGLNCNNKSFFTKIFRVFSLIANLIFNILISGGNKDAKMIQNIVDKRKDEALELISNELQEKVFEILEIEYKKENKKYLELNAKEDDNKKVYFFVDNVSKLSKSDIALVFQTVDTYLSYNHLQFVFTLDSNTCGLDDIVDIEGGGSIDSLRSLGKSFYSIVDLPTHLYDIRKFITTHYPEYVNEFNCDRYIRIIDTFNNNICMLIAIFNNLDLVYLVREDVSESIQLEFPEFINNQGKTIAVITYFFFTIKIRFTILYNKLIIFFADDDVTFEHFKDVFSLENMEENLMSVHDMKETDLNEYYKYKKMLILIIDIIDTEEEFNLFKHYFNKYFSTSQ